MLGLRRKTTSMFSSYGKKRFARVAAILQAILFSLFAFTLGLRIVDPYAARLPVDDVRLTAPADAIPSVVQNRASKSVPSEIRAVLFGAKLIQPIQLHGVGLASRHRPTLPAASPLLGSLLIRAPPSLGYV